MEFFSTRDRTIRRTPSQAIVEGIAPDKGLYLPDCFPAFPMEKLSLMSSADISVEVLSLFFDDFTKEELYTLVHTAYDESFENGEIAPLKAVGDAYCIELWHGPTCAFKDVALQLLPYLLTTAAKKSGVKEDICVLTATSGDTGSAALAGFSGVEGTRIAVFYPDGGVSPMQKRQMVTCKGKNTNVSAIKGNFDDAQSEVKRIFTEVRPPEGVLFSSANSINIGRLVPQIAYYFIAYQSLLAEGRILMGETVDFIVPTGNFGDILAGFFAKKMGLYVGKLVSASNENRVLADFFASGVYDRRREFHMTSSPSMDILISSNLERLIALVCGEEKNALYMRQLQEEGVYEIDADALDMIHSDFAAAWVNEEETSKTIQDLFRECNYLIDPHTAVGFAAYQKRKADETLGASPAVILSTASPYKFTKQVLAALKENGTGNEFDDARLLEKLSNAKMPQAIASLEYATVRHNSVVEISGMESFVISKAKEDLTWQ